MAGFVDSRAKYRRAVKRFEPQGGTIPPFGLIVEANKSIWRWPKLLRVTPSPNIPRIVNGTVHYKGKPFLPIGLYHVGDWTLGSANMEIKRIGAPTITRNEMLKSIKERGFNTILDYGGDSKDFIDDCINTGLLPIPAAAETGTPGAI